MSIPVEVTAHRMNVPSDADMIARWFGEQVTVKRELRRSGTTTVLERMLVCFPDQELVLYPGDWLVESRNGVFVLENSSFTDRYVKR
ncbi:hypothetical protein [Prescottella equi]|uniref:hypothetical protein n=1 Tax=Rhodococcus hoagii TaxID=43767 RepID=UPI0012F9C740|nr:hypothetical protein [Prescottella equi]